MPVYDTLFVYRKHPNYNIAEENDLVILIGDPLSGLTCTKIDFMVPLTIGDLKWVHKELFSRLVPIECPEGLEEIKA